MVRRGTTTAKRLGCWKGNNLHCGANTKALPRGANLAWDATSATWDGTTLCTMTEYSTRPALLHSRRKCVPRFMVSVRSCYASPCAHRDGLGADLFERIVASESLHRVSEHRKPRESRCCITRRHTLLVRASSKSREALDSANHHRNLDGVCRWNWTRSRAGVLQETALCDRGKDRRHVFSPPTRQYFSKASGLFCRGATADTIGLHRKSDWTSRTHRVAGQSCMGSICALSGRQNLVQAPFFQRWNARWNYASQLAVVAVH